MSKKIEIFKPGAHTTMTGETITFTEADVASVASGYDPKKFEAPFVVGHPKIDAPAYGWAKELEFSDGTLKVTGHQVEPQFAELVNTGRFKNISASLFRPDHPGNPNPGNWSLRHVGFLGAAAPAVKGLKQVSFGGTEDGTVDVVFGEEAWSFRNIARMFRSIREMIIDKSGKEEADSIIPSYQVDELDEAARRMETKSEPETSPEFSTTRTEEVDMTAEELKQQKEKLKVDQTAFAQEQETFKKNQVTLAAQANKALKAEAIAFCDGLVKQGKLLAAHAPVMVEVLFSLPADAQVEFADGDNKTTKPLAASFKGFLETLPKVVDFGQAAPTSMGEPAAGGEQQDAAFAEDLTQYV